MDFLIFLKNLKTSEFFLKLNMARMVVALSSKLPHLHKKFGKEYLTSVKVTTRHKGARVACVKVVARHEVQR
jgi:hypothetical protein